MAVLAFVVVFAVGLSLAGRAGQATRQVQVMVANRDIEPRERIAAGDVRLAAYPEAQLPPGAVVTPDAVRGQAALVRISKGQPITTNVISSSLEPADPSVSSYLPIPPGFVAVTIPTGEQQGVGGYIAVGDYINVLAMASTALFSPGSSREVTRTVFTSLHVIRVGAAPVAGAGHASAQQGVSSSLTVVTTECDAQFLSWLIANTTLKYALLSYHDYSPNPPPADPACPSLTAPSGIGPAQVGARFGFTRV